MPALVVATQALGEPRYPSLKGIMGARTKEIAALPLGDLDLGGAAVGGVVSTTRLTASRAPRRARRDPGGPGACAPSPPRLVVDFLAERRIIA